MTTSPSNNVWKMMRESSRKELRWLSKSAQGDTWSCGATPSGMAVGWSVEMPGQCAGSRADRQKSHPETPCLTLGVFCLDPTSVEFETTSAERLGEVMRKLPPVWTATSFVLPPGTEDLSWRAFSSLVSVAACATRSAMNPNSGCSRHAIFFCMWRLSPSEASSTLRRNWRPYWPSKPVQSPADWGSPKEACWHPNDPSIRFVP